MSKAVKILIVEDSEDDARLVVLTLQQAGFEVHHERVESAAATAAALQGQAWDAVIADYRMPGFTGFDALGLLRESGRDIPFILVSGTLGEERAVDAMKAGASDYVMKGNLARLGPALERELREATNRAAHRHAQLELQRFRQAMDAFADSIYLTDVAAMRFVYVNDAASRRLGFSREQLMRMGPHEVFKSDREQLRRELEQVIAAGERGMRTEARFFRADGSEGWTELHRQALGEDQRSVIVTIGRDITERKRAEERIRRLSRVHAMLSGINAAIVRVRNRKELFQEVCRIALEHGGFGMAWVNAFDPVTLDVTPVVWSGMDAQASMADMKVTARADVPQGTGVSARAIRDKAPAVCDDLAAEFRDGGARLAELIRRGYRSAIGLPLVVEGSVWGTLTLYAKETKVFTDDEVALLAEVAGDVSFALDHLRKEEQLNHLAYHDALTGLPTRAVLLDRVAQQIKAAHHSKVGMALVLIDLERFRAINEVLGRNAADGLLQRVAERLRGAVFDRDSVARLHGNVFAALLPAIADATDVARIVEDKIMACLTPPFDLGGQEVRIQSKAGVALFPGDATTAEALFSNAEAALRQAKASTERYLFYAPAMNAQVAAKLKLENKLRQALDREEFVLHYQPKIDLRRDRVSGLEALIRWNDPEQGLVPPNLFIPLLEETGLIVAVGEWAMRQAVSQYAAWRLAGVQPPRIAVNVSQVQMRRMDFVADVRRAIAATADAGHGLDLEITESMVMEDIAGNIDKLREVKAMGVEISIDDFGTGYSSLQYISRLPINALKIDIAFIRSMTVNANDMAMVSTIISLAHNLGLKVIAEGVETEDQSKFLRLLNCNEAQGYLFSKPLPAEQIEVMLRNAAATGKLN